MQKHCTKIKEEQEKYNDCEIFRNKIETVDSSRMKLN